MSWGRSIHFRRVCRKGRHRSLEGKSELLVKKEGARLLSSGEWKVTCRFDEMDRAITFKDPPHWGGREEGTLKKSRKGGSEGSEGTRKKFHEFGGNGEREKRNAFTSARRGSRDIQSNKRRWFFYKRGEGGGGLEKERSLDPPTM